MADSSDVLEHARRAFGEHRWDEARTGFTRAREQADLGADDVAALAECAWWQGDIEACLATYEEAYRLYVHGEQPATRQAAKLAMEVAYFWLLRGEAAIASGWIGRARRLLEDEPECSEKAYLRWLEVDEALGNADFDAAIRIARAVADAGQRYDDATLTALGLVGEGIATVKRGDVARGLTVLDEAMLPVVAGEVDPGYAGNIYCQLMSICHELADYERAQEWTDATARWCEGFPNAVMFLGICRVHRAQLMDVKGDWEEAEAEALRLCDELASMNIDAVAEGHYELGEVRRQRGDLDCAEKAYERARAMGRDPQPGLARLRLAQGRTDSAAEGIATALSTTDDPLVRARLCAAQVEVALAAADLPTAKLAAEEVTAAARRYGSSGLVAAADQARGAVALAAGDHESALTHLQDACRTWRAVGAPHRTAQVRMLLARTYQALGNDETATVELDAAEAEFERLGASLDLERVAELRSGRRLPDGLTAREAEVLGLVAAGMTNKEAADALFLSEKTIARHLSNIFTKLGVTSRTAAAAYAFEHGLASSSRG